MSDIASILLLNGSNLLPGQGTGEALVYPYAFVQVREVARRHGIHVDCMDISSMDGEIPVWPRMVETYLANHRPVAIGITIRQVDTLISSDCIDGNLRFNPIGITKRLINFLRSQTEVPIILGGFGFSAMARTVFTYLEADYGVCGAPDGMFANFESVLAGRGLAEVPNLMYWDGSETVTNPRGYFPPAAGTEYTHTVVADIERFYGTHRLFTPKGTTGVPVEVVRGCPYQCTFCIEPVIKGSKARVRDLEVVAADIDFLARQGIRDFWLVCSEINYGKSNKLFVSVAEIMIKIREQYGTGVSWNTYYLPRDTSREDLHTIIGSGFMGGWNDYVSLERISMKAAKVPFNLEQAQRMIQTRNVGLEAAQTGLRDWSIFLGHESNRPSSIRGTLETMLDMGHLDYYDQVTTINATRVFDLLERDYDEAYIRRVLPGDIDEYDLPTKNGFPTYYFNKSLVDALGGIDEVDEFFEYLRTAIISNEIKTKFDAARLLTSGLGMAEFRELFSTGCSLDPSKAMAAGIFNPRRNQQSAVEQAQQLASAQESGLSEELLTSVWYPPYSESDSGSAPFAAAVARILLFSCFDGRSSECDDVLRQLGLPDLTVNAVWTTPSFVIHRVLYRRFETQEALLKALEQFPQGGVKRLFFRFLIAYQGIELRPEYRQFFIDTEQT